MGKGKGCRRKATSYKNTGDAAICLLRSLLGDFRRSEGSSFFAGFDQSLLTSVKQFRSIPEKELGVVPVGRFKRVKQVEGFLKKFRFDEDMFSDDELEERSVKAFLDNQVILHQPLPLKYTGNLVLQRARKIAARILGDLPEDDIVEGCRFGRKSSIGCPLSDAYIDEKLSNKAAFTATGQTLDYFRSKVLPGDHILQRILAEHDVENLGSENMYSYLKLVCVPKTWKSYRLITPLTLIGLFYSYGVGRIVTARLEDAGLDISVLQRKHRGLVKRFSQTLTHATADLSAASDCITSELLNRILPRPWYNAVKRTFVRDLRINNETYSTASVLPMGNGLTFPVETLVFYCIISAIGELLKCKGLYSVYGDDLIYPTRLHRYVVEVFPQLHLKLNLDKTFVHYPFRESCGSDYYRGQAVRPFHLKGEAENLTPVRYEAWLYKVYNGLCLRWDPLEIKDTLTWILAELGYIARGINRVPPSFPDYSGIKVSCISDIPLCYHHLPWKPIYVHFRHGSRWFQFNVLTETPKKRVVSCVEPYYWLALQGLNDETVVEDYALQLQSFKRVRLTKDAVPREAPATNLSWEKVTTSSKTYWIGRKKVVKKRTTYRPVVASRVEATLLHKLVGTTDVFIPANERMNVSASHIRTDSISDWI